MVKGYRPSDFGDSTPALISQQLGTSTTKCAFLGCEKQREKSTNGRKFISRWCSGHKKMCQRHGEQNMRPLNKRISDGTIKGLKKRKAKK